MNWYIKALKKYAVFSGRARRKEYCYFILFESIIFFFFLLVFDGRMEKFPEPGEGPLSNFYALVTLLPGIAVTVRRLHDIDTSGWWMPTLFLPILNIIFSLVLMTKNSTPGENRFGPNPKDTTA